MISSCESVAGSLRDIARRLSRRQRKAFLATGKTTRNDLLVTACPGAGKTTSVAARAACHITLDQRVALTTYTNVAADEMASAIKSISPKGLPDYCFVGTLHKFLAQYVLHPFQGEILAGAPLLAIRVGDSGEGYSYSASPQDGSRYSKKKFTFLRDDFTFDENGRIFYKATVPSNCDIDAVEIARMFGKDALSDKEQEWQAGSVTADDAMHLCRRILESTDASAAIAERFQEVIVDEAQDCSPNQVECLRLIKERGGLKSIVLVGDFDQSIYGFQGAAPGLVRGLSDDLGLSVHELDENFRSSQVICNLVARLRKSAPHTAVGVNAEHRAAPICLIYPESKIKFLHDHYVSMLTLRGLSLDNSRIISRYNDTVSAIAGADSPWMSPFLKSLIGLACFSRGAISWKDIQRFEQSLMGRAELRQPLVGTAGREERVRIRNIVIDLADQLPSPQLTLGEWVVAAKPLLNSALQSLNSSSSGQLQERDWRIDNNQSRIEVNRLFRDAPRVACSTVHGAKGLSLDSILLVAGLPHYKRGNEADTWARLFDEKSPVLSDADESGRILYVALTRAMRLSCIAIPASTDGESIAIFREAGFEVDENML